MCNWHSFKYSFSLSIVESFFKSDTLYPILILSPLINIDAYKNNRHKLVQVTHLICISMLYFDFLLYYTKLKNEFIYEYIFSIRDQKRAILY